MVAAEEDEAASVNTDSATGSVRDGDHPYETSARKLVFFLSKFKLKGSIDQCVIPVPVLLLLQLYVLQLLSGWTEYKQELKVTQVSLSPPSFNVCHKLTTTTLRIL